MIDVELLKSAIDPIQFVEADVELHRVGNEWHGPCPLTCGMGQDRFRVRQDGYWACRQCDPRGGDLVSYVMRRDGVDFRTALASLAGWAGISFDNSLQQASVALAAPRLRIVHKPRSIEPSGDWKAAALEAVEQCEARLWSSDGERALTYLHEQRGLTSETIRTARLGFSVFCLIAGLTVPGGIVIPWFRKGEVVQLKIRTGSDEPGQKYRATSWANKERARGDGGHPYLYGVDDLEWRTTLCFAEGEFDALLLRQETGDLADVVSLGSASANLPDSARTLPLMYVRVLTLFDADLAGDTCTARLAQQIAGTRSVPLPPGLDITDMWRAGQDVRALVEPHVWSAEAPIPLLGAKRLKELPDA